MDRILIVDDDLVLRRSLSSALERNGWQVRELEAAEDALILLENEEFDVMLLDIVLRKMTGLDLLRGLTDFNRPKRVVVMTGYGSVERCKEAFQSGADDFLEKPFRVRDLLAAVYSAVVLKRVAAAPGFRHTNDELVAGEASGVNHVKAAMSLMKRRHCELTLSTRDVAHEVHVSTEYLCRLFRMHMHSTPMRELHRIRTAAVARLLQTTSGSVYQIARQCGYHTLGEVAFHFRRQYGCSPTEFRRADRHCDA